MSSQAQRSVTFASSTEEVDLVPSDSPESNKWYSREDVQSFKLAVLVEIRRLQGLHESGNLPEEELVSCIGIEKYLSRPLHQEIAQMRQAHRAIIVSRQGSSEREVLQLANISKAISGHERARAHLTALVYERRA